MTKTWIQIQNEPIKAIKKLNLKLAASRRIRDDNGLTMFSITGNQQGGKTTYGLNVLWEIYEHDVDEILRHVVMSAGDFAKMIMDAIDGGYRERAIMWDDLSVSGSAASWMTDPKFVKALGGLGDTMAVATKSVILSSPSGDMIKAFRNYSKYHVQIRNGSGKYGRVARGYWIGSSPMGEQYCSSEFEDVYDIRIPFYEQYAEKRRNISIKAAQEMMRLTKNEASEELKAKPITIKEKVLELKRDLEAGVFGDISLRQLCKTHKINYGYARQLG